MGIFDIFKRKAKPSGGEATTKEREAVRVEVNTGETSEISLEKSVISLDKALIDLTKKTGVSFEGHMAKVAVVMDYSGSMSMLYRKGEVQKALTRIMPIALKFDDNGELEVWLFNDAHARVEPMTLENYSTYVKREVENSHLGWGGTKYAPVLKDVLKKYFVEEKATSDIPTFVIFITDGENTDKAETDKVIRQAAKENIFIQFVGIGDENFRYLEKLDDLEGREVDNTGFIKVEDMGQVDDEALYNMLLDQYPEWIKTRKK